MKQKLMEELKKIQCPFTTWELDEIKNVIISQGEATHDDEDFIPLLKWIRSLVEVYEFVQKKTLKDAKESLKFAEEIWNSVKEKHEKNVSIQVLKNIYKGTKCFLLMEEEEFNEIDKILKTLNKNVDYDKNEIDRSTLNGCKGVAWSKFKDAGDMGTNKALDFIDLAIKDNSNCDVWHFMSGKNLRRQRRNKYFFSEPTEKEIFELKKAYELSEDPTYGIYLGQMYKEVGKKNEALKIYKKIHETKPESANINLRLALGFIRTRNLQSAKECLDFAEKKVPDDSMFLHYKGIFLETLKEYRKAADYFKKASTGHNYAAECSYLKCKAKFGETDDFVNYIKKMLITYENYESRTLDLTLQLAASYYLCNHDIPNAAKYYLEALEKSPNSKEFKRHACFLLSGQIEVYRYLKTDFLSKALSNLNLDSETKETCMRIQQICTDYYQQRREKAELDFGQMKLS
ncbi:uncharacterized protein LOC127281589 [Leptopilina boulardi]|uniref:uncharacterized protein LOC127281589 n=1 Tax=Leptopilina boulardi TaxID=63433 RepID=UPI0021F54F04|nr:uncharacterized protein LOC127281589 [Leptopilina boulardi]